MKYLWVVLLMVAGCSGKGDVRSEPKPANPGTVQFCVKAWPIATTTVAWCVVQEGDSFETEEAIRKVSDFRPLAKLVNLVNLNRT